MLKFPLIDWPRPMKFFSETVALNKNPSPLL